MTVVFTACSEPSPTDVADDFVTAVKTQDSDALTKVYIEKGSDVVDETDSSDLSEGLQQELIDKIFGLDYDIGSAFTLFMGEYISQAFGLALAGSSEEQREELAINIFDEKFKELEEKAVLRMGAVAQLINNQPERWSPFYTQRIIKKQRIPSGRERGHSRG